MNPIDNQGIRYKVDGMAEAVAPRMAEVVAPGM
jgi:hypothetical protein